MRATDSDRAGPMLNPPHLGELIRESMEEVGWNVTETAERLGCERETLSRLLNGKAGVSTNIAQALETIGWGTAEHWMRMQASYEVAEARRERTEAREIVARARSSAGQNDEEAMAIAVRETGRYRAEKRD